MTDAPRRPPLNRLRSLGLLLALAAAALPTKLTRMAITAVPPITHTL